MALWLLCFTQTQGCQQHQTHDGKQQSKKGPDTFKTTVSGPFIYSSIYSSKSSGSMDVDSIVSNFAQRSAELSVPRSMNAATIALPWL